MHTLSTLLTHAACLCLLPLKATVDASKAIMARLSGHGVKLVLPDLLKGLEDDSWRTKAGALQGWGTAGGGGAQRRGGAGVGHSRRGWGRD